MFLNKHNNNLTNKMDKVIDKRPIPRQIMPKDAQKVFSGILYDVYQWKQLLYDGSYKTFEMLKRPDTVICLPITTDKKIILTSQKQPGREEYIGCIGGRVDINEDPLDAIKRELLEESGFISNEWELWQTVVPVVKIDWVVWIFVAKRCTLVDKVSLDGGEKIKLKEVSFDEFIEIVSDEKFEDSEISTKILQARYDIHKMKALRDFLLT